MNIHSFKFKISVILMLCTLLPLAAATQLLSFYAEKNTITQAKEDIALSMEAQIQNMENVLKSVEDMQQDMKNERMEKIVVTGLDRISRNFLDVLAFADCAAGRGVSLEAINGDHATLDWSRQLYAALAAKGGERK